MPDKPRAMTVASAGKLKSALKVSSNSSTFTYSKTASAPISGTKEKKEVTVNARSPVKAAKKAESTNTSFDSNKLLMVVIAAFAKEFADFLAYDRIKPDTLADIINTVFWPTVLFVGLRARRKRQASSGKEQGRA